MNKIYQQKQIRRHICPAKNIIKKEKYAILTGQSSISIPEKNLIAEINKMCCDIINDNYHMDWFKYKIYTEYKKELTKR